MHNTRNVLNATELFPLKWFVLRYMKFTSKHKQTSKRELRGPPGADDRTAAGALTSRATCTSAGAALEMKDPWVPCAGHVTRVGIPLEILGCWAVS